jgi:hypothetical protein
MYKFVHNVSTMTGKQFRAGTLVPEGVFGALSEMVKAGDIVEIFKGEDPKEPEAPVKTLVPEKVVRTPEEKAGARVAALEKARATRAANKAKKEAEKAGA